MYQKAYSPEPQGKECCRECTHWEKRENYCHLKERYVSGGYACASFERWGSVKQTKKEQGGEKI